MAETVSADNNGDSELQTNQLATSKARMLRNKDYREIKHLETRLQGVLSSNLPLIQGDSSKKEQCLKIMSKSLRILTRLWENSSAERVQYDRRQKNVIKMGVRCGAEFTKNLPVTYTTEEFRELSMLIGDFYRFAAEAKSMFPISKTMSDIEDHESQTEPPLPQERYPFAKLAAYAWFHYDQAHPRLDVYYDKVKTLFEAHPLHLLIANLRYTLITVDQNGWEVEPHYITYIENSCVGLKRNLEESNQSDDDISQRVRKFMDTFLLFLKNICNQLKEASIQKYKIPATLQRSFNKVNQAWNRLQSYEIDRHMLHSMILVVALTGKLFALIFQIPPLQLSSLLRSSVMMEVARSDFISEERPDLWDDLTRYVMQNTALRECKDMITLIRQLNSRPASLVNK